MNTSCLFTYQKVKGSSCFLFGYIWFQNVRAVPIDELHPTFSQGISINYKNDFMLTGCCQGQTEHPLSIPAAPKRVLFVYRRLEIQWEIRFFAIPAPANRNFGRATIHMIEYLWVLHGIYHGWRCPSRVFIIESEKLVGFQKKFLGGVKISPPR